MKYFEWDLVQYMLAIMLICTLGVAFFFVLLAIIGWTFQALGIVK